MHFCFVYVDVKKQMFTGVALITFSEKPYRIPGKHLQVSNFAIILRKGTHQKSFLSDLQRLEV